MGKTIKCTLSQKSIRNAINELKAYQKDLQRKNELFVKRLCEEGLQVIQTTMESIPDEEKGSYYTEIIYNKNGDITGASVRLSGDKVLFIEFSAGITYGSNNYPLPSGSEYGVGTYPGQTHAFSPYGWWYTDERSGENAIHMEIERTCLCITQNKPLLLLFAKLPKRYSLLKEDTIIY